LAEHPALDVDVLLSDAPKDLIEGGIDVALRLGELTDSSMTARKIGQSQRRVIGSPTYFEAMGVPQTPADLAKHQAVFYDQPAGGTAWTFRRGTVEMSVTIEGRVRVPSRPSLFRQYKRISTQHYGDGRKDNSRCKLRDLFYFWCGLLLAWRRRQRRWLLWWLRR
jgi:DNA-binding transcriptional LysR family regulator